MEKLVFLFPGQGSQYVQMGKSFYDNYTIARQTYEEASDVLQKDIAQLCFNSGISALNDFSNMQYAIFVTGIAIFRSYMSDYGIAPQFVVGHSIGEYTALTAAGAIEFADCLTILGKRAELVERINKREIGRMTIFEGSTSDLIQQSINELGISDSTFISCYNSELQTAVSGLNEQMDSLEQLMVESGAACSPMLYSPPMHSPLMEEEKEEFRQYLTQISYNRFIYPIITNVEGKPLSDTTLLPQLLSEHLVSPVLWTKSMNNFVRFGISSSIEMGPKTMISSFLRTNCPDVETYCYGVNGDRLKLNDLFNSDQAFKKDMPNLLGACLTALASSPDRIQDDTRIHRVIEIYDGFKKHYMQQTNGNLLITADYQRETLQQLIEALKLKGLEKRDIEELLREILHENNLMYSCRDILYQI